MLSQMRLDVFPNFSVSKEYSGVELKAIQGVIPTWLKGSYLKVGPAWRQPGEVKHILDGDGYLTHLQFNNGKACLSGRYLTDTRKSSGPDAFGGPMLSLVPLKNKMNTNILKWGNDLITFYEGCPPKNIFTDQVWGPYKHGIPMKGLGGNAVNAHYKRDGDILHILDFKYSFGFGLGTWMRWKSFNQTKEIGEVTTYIPHFVYLHDWGVTQDYFVFIYHPLSITLKDFRKGIASNLRQKYEEPAKVYVISRTDGSIVNCMELRDNNAFSTHIIDCKQNKEGIELTVIAYESVETISKGKSFQMLIDIHMKREKVNVMIKNNYLYEFPSQHFATFGMVNHPMEGIIRLTDNAHVVYDEDAVFGEPIEICEGRYVMFLAVKHDAFETPICTTVWVCDSTTFEVICILMMPDAYVPLGLHGIWIEETI
jgi:carotenoid cleavage dioxygenase-like enzyme